MWEQMLVSTDRGTFEIFVSGSGEPLCITHLYSEFNERGYYFADMFFDSFRVYLVNLKDAGNSSRAVYKEELSMEESVKDLESIRRALDIEVWSFAGHSAGGMLGLVYGYRCPKSLKRLSVGGASASKDYMEHEASIYCRRNPNNERIREILSILGSHDSPLEVRRQAGREWTEMSLYDPSRYDEYFSKPSSGKVVQTRLDYYSYDELEGYDLREDIPRIATPTIVYCGRHDSQCPFVFSEEIHQLVPGSKLFVFEKSNHSPFLEEKIRFAELVEEYIKLA